jgi:hypothetical protein
MVSFSGISYCPQHGARLALNWLSRLQTKYYNVLFLVGLRTESGETGLILGQKWSDEKRQFY